MAHTPGPWREGKTADSIVADSPEGLPPYTYPEVLEHYGGYVVAESVAPCNKPLIMAAPDLLKACKAVIRYVDDHDAVVGAWGDIYEMLQKAVAKAEGDRHIQTPPPGGHYAAPPGENGRQVWPG